MKKENNSDYKIVISELGSNPFRVVDIVFVLMSIIPLLALFYLISQGQLLQRLFLGHNGSIATIAILISVIGFLYAYLLIKNVVARLLKYAQERRLADNEKTEVVLTVSHDLKNPLTNIKASMDSLIEGVGGELNDAQVGMVKICLSNTERLFKFIDEITSASKDDFIRMFIKRELLDLGHIVGREVDDFMPLVKKSNLELRYQVPKKSVSLWADESKLTRVVMNLLSNAIKYTPQGGVIDIVVFSDSNTVTLSVKNTGPGIMPDEMKKIFKRYGRLEKHSEIEGAGLGLSIVKEIVDLHDGHITVEGELGKNIEFRVTLPRDLREKAK